MNNEPVAWIDPKELDMDVSTSVTKNKQFESDIPLYVQPQKYCPSENNEAYEKGFIDGMAKQRDSKVQQMVEGYTHPVKELKNIVLASATCSCGKVMEVTNLQAVKELTDEEITACIDESEPDTADMIRFAKAILRKAQEK